MCVILTSLKLFYCRTWLSTQHPTTYTFIRRNIFNLKLNKPSANPSQVLFKSNYSTIHDHIQIQHANTGPTTGNLQMKDLNVCLFGQFAVKGNMVILFDAHCKYYVVVSLFIVLNNNKLTWITAFQKSPLSFGFLSFSAWIHLMWPNEVVDHFRNH